MTPEVNSIEYRGYRITPLGTRSVYRIQARGQGTIPNSLEGEYTQLSIAKASIDRSLTEKPKRGERANGKKASAPSDKQV